MAEARRVLRPGGRVFVKDVFLKDGPLAPGQQLELAEFRRTYLCSPLTADDFSAASEFQVQDLSGDYRVQPYVDGSKVARVQSAASQRYSRRFFHLPVSVRTLMGAQA